MSWEIDINCDLGEGAGNDAEIMPLIHSCSIACGGHYGTTASIRATITLAKKHGVKVGAHPSFLDPHNFGRVQMDLDAGTLKASIIEQVQLFQSVAKTMGVMMNHVKLHGALYNLAAKDELIAQTVIAALLEVGTNFSIYAPYKSELQKAGEAYYTIIPEVFIDRTYQKDGSLTPRSNKNALITDPLRAWQQIENCLQNKTVSTINNELIPLYGKTFCIHGDADHCLALLTFVNQQLNNA
ncbi:MAG: LamB/YcsF family protein [Flavobacteriaceae bacterium]|nr:LamB/YcsF family protein [Flavobacteriaceae bacterium]